MDLLYWYWDKQVIENETPSIQDGMDYATEVKFRKEGASFILKCGIQMSLGYNTTATGVVFFHRFYMFHSFKTFPPYVTATCCLYLAGKVEETPKKCYDIIDTVKALLNEEDFAIFGDNPVKELRDMEKILLKTIKFDFKVSHPYFYLKKYIKCIKANRDSLQEVLQMAWNFVNDSWSTTLSIEWEPEIIAIAVIYLASKLCQLKVTNWTDKSPEHKYWWDMFVQDINVKLLEDICHQILDLYSSGKSVQSVKFAEAAKAMSRKSSSRSKPTTSAKEPKVETSVPLNHSQPSAPEVPKATATSPITAAPPPPLPPPVAASWTPTPPVPSIPPVENALQPSFTLPNLTVPPPTSYVPTSSAMPPTNYPMMNMPMHPQNHMPFPQMNLAVPPPGTYYASEQYARYWM